MTGPYASSAMDYWKAGWTNAIPVQGKSLPIGGYTGREGKQVGWSEIAQWTAGDLGSRNVGLRMKLNALAIDVDDYGDKDGGSTMAGAEARLGPLPATWTSTSRGPGQPARIHFFRIPVGTVLPQGVEKRFNKEFGQSVDLIHHRHRYTVVAPSVHPDTGNRYAWYAPGGELSHEVPAFSALPELPAAWLDFLTADDAPAPPPAGAAVDDDDLFEAAGKAPWRRDVARRELDKRLEELRAMDSKSKVEETINASALFFGHFVPALLTAGDATRELLAAIAENPWHSDSWNIANNKSWSAASKVEGGLSDGMDDPWEVAEETAVVDVASGELSAGVLPQPGDPMAVARALVPRMTQARTWWRGDFYSHRGAHWEVSEVSLVEQWLYRQTERATYIVKDSKGEETPKSWAPTKKKITDLTHALGTGVLQRTGEDEKCVAPSNGVLRITGRVLLPHTPDRFNLSSLPFAYDADADAPAWQAFLDSVLPGDRQAQDFLGEWFGYVLSGRTDHQKMAALIGERRSGKGTIARVLGAMLGGDATAGLDLNLVAGNFGLENLIGKSLAVSGDVRWQSRNVGDAVPVLLGVIGEDAISVHRKNRPSWNGRLGVRFMLMSNETPTFSDRSGALGGRMIYLKFNQSFYGREDIGLTEKLLSELPGILNWALDGLDRLNGRGRFTEPDSGRAEAESVRRLSDPLGAFLEDWCEVGEGLTIGLDHLYLKYRDWCDSEGRTRDSTTKEIFSRDLRSKVLGLEVKRVREAGKQVRKLVGVTSHAM